MIQGSVSILGLPSARVSLRLPNISRRENRPSPSQFSTVIPTRSSRQLSQWPSTSTFPRRGLSERPPLSTYTRPTVSSRQLSPYRPSREITTFSTPRRLSSYNSARGPSAAYSIPSSDDERRREDAVGGFECCCCRCCTCFNFRFLKTKAGFYKFIEVTLSGLCQSLLSNYGQGYAGVLGSSYASIFTTSAACLLTSSLILICALISNPSYLHIRQSLFEPLFNVIACFLYLSSSSFFSLIVNTMLSPLYFITPYMHSYPALTASYVCGFILALVHGLDAFRAYQAYCKPP